MTAPHLRPATAADVAPLWAIYHEIVVDGRTYPNPADTTQAEFHAAWFEEPHVTIVAETDGRVVGGYKLRPMQPGRGAHVVNASYIVDAACRGEGIGRAMVMHSLEQARGLSYRAMQFGFVVSTNTGAIHLYEDLGFSIVGTVPDAFDHPDHGRVAAHVMYRAL
jgi:L-amino acid N-acyltransferase YncA